MIRSIIMNEDGNLQLAGSVEGIQEILTSEIILLWVDLAGEPTAQFSDLLHNTFGFHPLAIDDALTETHIPKVDDWGEYLYLVLEGALIEEQNELSVKSSELDIFVGKNYVITYHEKDSALLDKFWEHCQRDPRYLNKGAMRLLYHLSDEIVNHFVQVSDIMAEKVNQIEDSVFNNPSSSVLNKIFILKRSLQYLRRTISHQREVYNKLSRGGISLVDESDAVYFRDTYDHMTRLQESMDGLREMTNGALDTYLSVVNNRMNEVMKTLTIITTLFMPLSFLTGFFGMNFFQASFGSEIWTGKLFFGFVLALTILVPVSMYLWMRKRAWM